MDRSNLLFLIALVVGLGVAYLAIDQAYSTGNVVTNNYDISLKSNSRVSAASTLMPDLVVTDISYEVVDLNLSDGIFKDLNLIQFYVKVKNMGNAKLSKLFYVYFDTGSSSLYKEYGYGTGSSPFVGENASIVELAAGQEKKVPLYVSFLYNKTRGLSELKVNAKACADMSLDKVSSKPDANNNLVNELNENNNCLVKSFVIPLVKKKVVPPKPVCFDSDKGLNYSVAGYVQYAGTKKSDYCANNTLFEGWCSARGGPTFARYECPKGYGCNKGACVKSTNQAQTCNSGIVINNFKNGCCYNGATLSDYSVYNVANADLSKVACIDKKLYACEGSFEKTSLEITNTAGIEFVESYSAPFKNPVTKDMLTCSDGHWTELKDKTCLSAGFGFLDVFLKCKNNNFNYDNCEPSSGGGGDTCESNLDEKQDYQTVCYAGTRSAGNWAYCSNGCKNGACIP